MSIADAMKRKRHRYRPIDCAVGARAALEGPPRTFTNALRTLSLRPSHAQTSFSAPLPKQKRMLCHSKVREAKPTRLRPESLSCRGVHKQHEAETDGGEQAGEARTVVEGLGNHRFRRHREQCSGSKRLQPRRPRQTE